MKPSRYNFFVSSFFEGTVIAYNSLWGSFFTMSEGDMSAVKSILDSLDEGSAPESDLFQKLVEHKFVVPDALDERAEIRGRYRRSGDKPSQLSLTIAPTVSCNFGCTYCFQEHPKAHMGPEDIEKILRYVDRRLTEGDSLHVTWFGGEPLLAFDVVVKLCEALTALCSERNCAFIQSMITNGSLLDEKKVAFLSRQKNFQSIQITLDGPPETHDRRRPTVGNKPTFFRILENVKRAAEVLPISIRVNIDRTNYRDLDRFIDVIVDQGLRNRVSLYLGHTLPYTEVCAGVETVALTKEEFAEIDTKFQFLLFQRGFTEARPLPKPQVGNLCVADNDRGAVLAPGGVMFRCWNEVSSSARNAVGTLETEPEGSERSLGSDVRRDDRMVENQSAWESYDPFSHEMCKSCKVQPLCLGGCPWEARKNPQWSTGHCTPLKFNLPDTLRIYHMQTAISKAQQTREQPGKEQPQKELDRVAG
jgi:uncharacterized protein